MGGTSDRTLVDTYPPWCVDGITGTDLSGFIAGVTIHNPFKEAAQPKPRR